MDKYFRSTTDSNIAIDGVIFNFQKHGGISRIFTEILPRLCDIDSSLKMLLAYTEPRPAHLPKHERILHQAIPDMEKVFRPYRIWHPFYPWLHEAAVSWNFAGNSRGKIWLSTYYTTPISWAGAQVVFVYDFIHEKYQHTYWLDDPKTAKQTIKNKARAIKNADLIVCISEATRQDLLQIHHIPPEKTVVVHLAQHPIFSVKSLGTQKSEKPFILFVGNRNRYKGFDTLLKALSSWKQKDMDLVCAGGGEWSKEEKEEIASYGLASRIKLFIQVSDDRLCELYNQASAFIYPSLYEGFGIPLLEAMACGCPIIASRIPSSVEVAQDVPIYFTAGDPQDLTAALAQFASQNETAHRRQEGILLAGKYSWEKTAKDFYKAIQPLLQSSSTL